MTQKEPVSKKEYEELKKELNGSEKWRIKAESLNDYML